MHTLCFLLNGEGSNSIRSAAPFTNGQFMTTLNQAPKRQCGSRLVLSEKSLWPVPSRREPLDSSLMESLSRRGPYGGRAD